MDGDVSVGNPIGGTVEHKLATKTHVRDDGETVKCTAWLSPRARRARSRPRAVVVA